MLLPNILLKNVWRLIWEGGTRPLQGYNSKSKGSDLKNRCLSKNSNLTGITFEHLFTLMHTLKLKDGQSSI
jgi:hypothetical protein